MNENDVQDREVLEYVRNRMAADMPPEFTRDVMNDVHRTTQRRRGFAWPILTGLATVAAAVAVVVIGLGLINGPNDVGSQPTPSATASPSASPSPTPEGSASPTLTPTPNPSPEEGEFGPIHSMTPEFAFTLYESCLAANVITTVGTDTDLGWTVAFPDGWSTNEDADARSGCTLFAPEPFDAPDDQSVPAEVAISASLPPGGDFDAGPEATSEEFTVDGVAAIRYDIPAGGFTTERTTVWIIAIAGNLPAEGNDQPYLAFSTSSANPNELAVWTEVLDRMVATLDFGD